MSNEKILDVDDTYDKEKLGLFFDPYIFNELKSFRSYGIEVNRLIIVFWDISNFSDFTNELAIGRRKEELLLFLKEYYHAASQIINNNNGILDKFIGDGIFAYFGIKDIKFDDVPNRTILAAIELRKIFDDIKNRHLKLWNNYFGFKPHTNIDLKCAIHVGDVIFGYWNSPSRVQITAMGKNVNFCSRLEGYANKNQIIVSKEVNELVIDKFETNKLYIPKSERMKSFKHIDYVYEIIRPKF